MRHFLRIFMSVLFILILFFAVFISFSFVGHNLPANVSDLFAKPANRTSFFINIFSSIAFTILCSLLLLSRRTVFRWAKAFLLRGRSKDEERIRIDQEKLYLENLIERIRCEFPWEVNKYTDLEVIQEDMEKQARRVRPHFWSLPDTKETHVESNLRSRVNVRHFLRKEKGPIMLKGDPGTGKTLTIRRFAVDQAEDALRNLLGEPKLPIYIFLGAYVGKTLEGEPESVFDFLQRYLQEEFPAAAFLRDRENLEDYLIRGRLLLMFDGLNELPPDEYTSRYQKLEDFVLRKYRKNKAIFTCRTLRYTSLAHFNTVAISDLDNNQIKRFITAYRGEVAAEGLYQDLTSGDGFMLRICRNPYMLQMLVRRNPARPTPQSPAQLFREYVYDQLASVSDDVERTSDVLREVAFTMQKEGKFAGVVDYEWLKAQLPHLPLDDHLRIAQQAQLIDYTLQKKFRFYHQILQEYFAAIAIQKEWQEAKSLEMYFADYRWEETTLVCAGIVIDAEKFISGIWQSDKVSPEAFWLATKAVGSSGRRVSVDYYRALIQKAMQYLDPNVESPAIGYSKTVLVVETLKALSYIDDDQTIKLLSSTLQDYDGWIRELCIQILGASRHPLAHIELRLAITPTSSLSDLLILAPYFDTSEWIWTLIKKRIFYDLSLRIFPKLIIYLLIATPLIFLVSQITRGQLFALDSYAILTRLLAILLFIKLIIDNFKDIYKIIFSRVRLIEKLAFLREWLTWKRISYLFIVLALWLVSYDLEIMTNLKILISTLGILYLYVFTIYSIFALFTKTRSVSLLAYYLYSYCRIFLYLSILFTIESIVYIYLSYFYYIPSTITEEYYANYRALTNLPSSPANSPSNFTANISHATINANFQLNSIAYNDRLLITFYVVIYAIGIASAAIHLTTFFFYWRIRQYRIAFAHGDKTQAAQKIMKIAMNSSGWPHIRKKAIKELRLIEISYREIEDLEHLIENYPDLHRELERTIYELYSRAREKDREVPDRKMAFTLARQGEAHLDMLHYQEALDCLNQALRIDKEYTLAIAVRGDTYRLMRRYQEALTDLNRAISFNDRYDMAIANRGRVYRQMGCYEQSLTDFNHALSLNEADAWTIAGRGETYRLMGRYQEALADFTRAISLDRKLDWAISSRGETYRLMGRYQEALADFTRAISLNEKEDSYRYCRAIVHLQVGQTSDFKSDLQTAIKLAQVSKQSHPDDLWIDFSIALYNLVDGNVVEAEQQYDHFISICTSLGMLQDAVSELVDFLTIQPSHDIVQRILARLRVRISQLK